MVKNGESGLAGIDVSARLAQPRPLPQLLSDAYMFVFSYLGGRLSFIGTSDG